MTATLAGDGVAAVHAPKRFDPAAAGRQNGRENRSTPMSLPLAYVLLAIAITSEVIATTALALSNGLSKPLPVVISALGYALALGLLAVVMQVMPTGVVYAIWSGLGVVLITLVAWAWQGQRLDLPAVIGMGLIVAGVIVVNVFSGSVGH